MKKTLLDFITGCVTPREARRFYRAMGGPDETQDFLEKVQRHYKEPKGIKDGVKDYFADLTKRLFGLEKTPLDLTPEEIGRLSEIVEDRQDTVGYQIQLVGKNFDHEESDLYGFVKKMLPGLYEKYKQYFINPQDLMLIPPKDGKPAVLNIRSRKRIVKEVLQALRVKPDVIENVLEGKSEEEAKKHGETYRVDFSRVVEPEKLASINPADLKKFGQVANTFLEKRDGGHITVENEKTPPDAYFTFKGDLEFLGELFYAARRDDGGKYFPMDFPNDAVIESLLKTLAADRKA